MSKADSYLDANFVFADFISMCYGMDSNSWENVNSSLKFFYCFHHIHNISGNVCKIQLHKYPYFMFKLCTFVKAKICLEI